MSHDVATSLRSELAALQYKRDRLLQELQDTRGQLRSREQRALELQVQTEQLQEQAARQTAIIASLRRRIQELEEKERNLSASQSRAEMAVQTLQRENQYKEEKVKNLEKRVRTLELECHSEEASKESQRRAMEDLVRRLSAALGAEQAEAVVTSPEGLVHKASELVQETSRLRAKSGNVSETLSSVELELKGCKDALDRAVAERDSLQRQAASHLLEIDRIRQEKENLEMQQRVTERELSELREKLSLSNRSLSSATNNVAVQESTICQLREDLSIKDEKLQRVHNELRHFLESLAIQLSSPTRFVESNDTSIKERIAEVLQENKDKATQAEQLREKTALLAQQLGRQTEAAERADAHARKLLDDKMALESRLRELEAQLAAAEASRDSLRRDKNTFMSFLERLARVLSVEEMSKEVGVDLHTETLLLRAEQLARLESDKLLDKYLYLPPYTDYYWWRYGTFPRLRRERSYHEFPSKETSTVYQLQRRVRTLREQLQRRDLHLDLLRRKLSLQEDGTRARTLLESERDEANLRVKKLLKQVERLQLEVSEARAQTRELKTQLGDAAEYKISALERARKIEELQKRLVESEMLRTRYSRKVTLLKDQVRATSQSAENERSLHEHNTRLLRDELASVKQSLGDSQRRENALLSFRTSVAKLLNLEAPLPDYEIVSRLQKLVQAHRDFTSVSRRYDDPLLTGGSRTPLLLGHSPAGTRTPRYDDSGFVDPPDLSALDDSDDLNGVYNKRPLRGSP